MARRKLRFEDERPEWTERKHRLLQRVAIPSGEKMKWITPKRCVAFVDGYAGPNKYGETVGGSTAILTAAAGKIAKKEFPARVFACEPIKKRYDEMVRNLDEDIQSGLLTTYNCEHAAALAEIQREVTGWPTFVFLDPHGPKDLKLEADLLPWLNRRHTDVLGVFMANAAARACAEAAAPSGSDASRATAHAILGADWRAATTEADAYRVFMGEIGGHKRFTGIYPLRKMETQHRAYGLFGASDSEHGFHLLSDAVARDWGALQDFDFSRTKRTLFSDMDKEDEQQSDFEQLMHLVRPIVQADATLNGQKLALALYRSLTKLDTVFGRYKESDYTKAAQECRRSAGDG